MSSPLRLVLDNTIHVGFDAPPLEDVNLAFYSLCFVASSIQLICAVTYIFRGRSPHLLPGVAAIVAFVFLMVLYAFGVAIVVADWVFDEFGDPVADQKIGVFVNILTASNIFFFWVDPAIFAVIALVLQDRYRTYQKHAASATEQHLPILPFIFITWLLIAMLVITSSASAGFSATASSALFSQNFDIESIRHDAKLARQFWDAFVAFVFSATVSLLVLANLVKRYTREDKIVSITLFWIMPFLGARALAWIAFDIIDDRFILKPSSNSMYALGLSRTIVYGGLHFIIACFLVHFFLAPRLWYGPGEEVEQCDNHYGGGVQPVAQFPGQGGYVGQSQPGYPYPEHPQQG